MHRSMDTLKKGTEIEILMQPVFEKKSIPGN